MEIRLGDYGTEIKVTIQDDAGVVDLSGATLKQFVFKAPDGTVTDKAAAFDTDGTDGVLKYVLEQGFVDQDGLWYFQAEVSLSATEHWLTNPQELPVGASLG